MALAPRLHQRLAMMRLDRQRMPSMGQVRAALRVLGGMDGAREATSGAERVVAAAAGARGLATRAAPRGLSASVALRTLLRPALVAARLPLARVGGRGGMTRSLTTARAAQLRRLEVEANGSPGDARAQAKYLAALNREGFATEVIKRCGSGRFAASDAVHVEHVRAMVLAGLIPESQYGFTLERLRGAPAGGMGMVAAGPAYGYEASSVYGGGAAAAVMSSSSSSSLSSSPPSVLGAGGALGTVQNPLVVQAFQRPNLMSTLSRLAWFAFYAALIYFLFFRRGGTNPLESITGPSAAEVADIPETRFVDVKGVDEAKHELEDIVKFLTDPSKYTRLGAKVPKGVLLTGPPGTGKTLLARAVAGEAGVKFYAKSASEFEEMLVGLGAKRVRDLFDAAKQNAPAIIFIDEIDAMGAKRGRVSVGASSERQTLNQLLACMDGFSKNENVVVIAATNSPDILDPALTRPGRFDTKVQVPLPDIKGRREILDYYLGKVRIGEDVDADVLAAATPGMSGAMLEALVNQAALLAANRDAEKVELRDLEEARDKVWMGPAMRSRVRTKEELRLTALHEGGHTIAGLLTPQAQELHKVTILARGPAGGVTFFLDDDNQMMTREKILAAIDVAMGGRVAEELFYGESGVTTGAGSDMQNATEYARRYVKYFSMGHLGLSTYDESDPTKAPSPETKTRIDKEVEDILQASYARVKTLLTTNKHRLESLAEALLEHETLSADECRRVLQGEQLPPPAELARARLKELSAKVKAQRAKETAAAAAAGAAAGGGGARGTGVARRAAATAASAAEKATPSSSSAVATDAPTTTTAASTTTSALGRLWRSAAAQVETKKDELKTKSEELKREMESKEAAKKTAKKTEAAAGATAAPAAVTTKDVAAEPAASAPAVVTPATPAVEVAGGAEAPKEAGKGRRWS